MSNSDSLPSENQNENSPQRATCMVVGNGTAAVFAASELIKRGKSLVWYRGTGAQLIPVVPYMKSERALGVLLDLQGMLSEEVYAHPLETGVFHRVFRNKEFKMPSWKRSTDPETQKEAFEATVWSPERVFLGTQEYRVSELSPHVLEQELREFLENHDRVQMLTDLSESVDLNQFEEIFYCDSFADLKRYPKWNAVLQKQLKGIHKTDRTSVLQVEFHHKEELELATDIAYVVPMNRDSGETFDRSVMGYFYSDADGEFRSVWTVFLQSSESEENHAIMKKLRRLKQSLNKAFESSLKFTDSVAKEKVRFEANLIVSETISALTQSTNASGQTVVLASDSFGISGALEQLGYYFNIEPVQFEVSDSEEHAQDSDDTVLLSGAEISSDDMTSSQL